MDILALKCNCWREGFLRIFWTATNPRRRFIFVLGINVCKVGCMLAICIKGIRKYRCTKCIIVNKKHRFINKTTNALDNSEHLRSMDTDMGYCDTFTDTQYDNSLKSRTHEHDNMTLECTENMYKL